MCFFFFFFFKQKPAYELKECDWGSDLCSSVLGDLLQMMLLNFLESFNYIGSSFNSYCVYSVLEKDRKSGV